MGLQYLAETLPLLVIHPGRGNGSSNTQERDIPAGLDVPAECNIKAERDILAVLDIKAERNTGAERLAHPAALLEATQQNLSQNTSPADFSKKSPKGKLPEHSQALLLEICAQLQNEGFQMRQLANYTAALDLGSQQHFLAFLLVLPQNRHEEVAAQKSHEETQAEAYKERQAETQEAYKLLDQVIEQIRHSDEEVPIFLYGKEKEFELLSQKVVRQCTGFIHYGEDTVEFTARYISRTARHYLETSLPIFFRHLMEYVENGAQSWHCPGHSGGTAFLKSHVGKIFHRFFGENLLRADVCNAVEGLGQLLEHTGYIGASERNAAHVFHADKLYFVTNGTSASNRIVAQASIAEGDLVLVDRNCHQSVLHAVIQTGAIPIFLRPSRNAYGIVGPIPESQFEPESIAEAIRKNPLVSASASIWASASASKGASDQKVGHKTAQTVRAMVLTQSTYDGILYNSKAIQKKLDGYIPVLHFDEAWLPHAVFHDFYYAMHAMRDPSEPSDQAPQYSTVYATQSPHKVLAGLSQASQILVQNAKEAPLDPAPLETSFLMHSSSSPQYSILASLDVSSAMMSGAGGYAIVEETLQEALHFRQALRDYGQGLDSWWFRDWGPAQFSCANPSPDWLQAESEASASSKSPKAEKSENNLWQKEWRLSSKSDWHGFAEERSNDFNILDPIKCTLLTPGLGADGKLQNIGIPAMVVSRYLQENGIIVEKSDLYSLFIMFTIGATKGRWKSLLSALQRFKLEYDSARALWQSMPQFCLKYPQYADYSIVELCQCIHDGYRSSGIVQQTEWAYSSELEPAVTPSEAYRSFVRGQYSSLPISEICGKISASMICIYPPGIPLVFPGERISREVQDYLCCIEQQQRQFSGFELHIHGIQNQNQAKAANKTTSSFLVNVLDET